VGTPLISYILDDQLKEPVRKALRVTNEDRGIVAGVPGAGKTAYLVLQLIDGWSRDKVLSQQISSLKFGRY
jgi:predicted PilT family ATPase